MQAKDHLLLGDFLLKRHHAKLSRLCRTAFLLGCIEPDINLATYARGSLKYQFMRGHNAENASRHLTRLTRKLQRSRVQTPIQWFRFGAALRYLADSFTYVHNSAFTGNLKAHRHYEQMLHPVFAEYLDTGYAMLVFANSACHKRYLSEPQSCQTDCRYILGTTLGLCSKLDVQWEEPDLTDWESVRSVLEQFRLKHSNQ